LTEETKKLLKENKLAASRIKSNNKKILRIETMEKSGGMYLILYNFFNLLDTYHLVDKKTFEKLELLIEELEYYKNQAEFTNGKNSDSFREGMNSVKKIILTLFNEIEKVFNNFQAMKTKIDLIYKEKKYNISQDNRSFWSRKKYNRNITRYRKSFKRIRIAIRTRIHRT